MSLQDVIARFGFSEDTSGESTIVLGGKGLRDAFPDVGALTAAFDPALHPHEPGGSSKGGQWARKMTAPTTVADVTQDKEATNTLVNQGFLPARTAELNHGEYEDYGQVTKRKTMESLSARLLDDPDWDPLAAASILPGGADPPGGSQFSADLNKETTARLIQQWSYTAGDHSVPSILIQNAAAQEFGIPFDPRARFAADPDVDGLSDVGAATVRANWENDRKVLEMELGDEKSQRALRAFVRAQYAETQAMFEGLGIKPTDDLTLFRGMKFSPANPSPFEDGFSATSVTSNPMSSWSVSYPTAVMFGSTPTGYTKAGERKSAALLSAKIPASRVLSTPMTGDGALGEYEVVVIGAPSGDRALVRSSSGGDARDTPSYEEYLTDLELSGVKQK